MKKKLWFLTGVLMMNSTLHANSEKLGDILYMAMPMVAYGTSLYKDDTEGQTQFYKSFLTNVGVTYGLKYAVNAKRPNGEEHSFPSGHTSVSFQAASFLHKRYGLEYALPAYVTATFVGYSRVESDHHYRRDVLAGAAVGALSSYYFTSKYKKLEIKPMVTGSAYGLRISRRW